MANNSYNQEVAPNQFLLAEEEEQGLIKNSMLMGNPVRRGRSRSAGGGSRDKLTMAEMKARISSFWKDGDSYIEIADQVSDEFGLEGEHRLKPRNIGYHVSQMLASAKKLQMLHINERQALILARYDQIELLCTEAYFASMTSETKNYEKQIHRAKSKDRGKQMVEDLKRERERISEINSRLSAQKQKRIREDPLDDPLGDLPFILRKTSEKVKKYKRTESKPAGDPRFLQMLIDINDKRAKLWGLLNRSDNADPDQELAKLSDEERQSKIASLIHAAKMRITGDTGALAPASPLGGFQEGDEPETHELVEHAEDEGQIDWEFD
jgi:hypothetical protein